MSGKGDKLRPRSPNVSPEKVRDNWDAVFGKKRAEKGGSEKRVKNEAE